MLNANAQAVLETIKEKCDHPTAAEVYDKVREQRPHIGLASVYRILHMLVERGYVKELRNGDEACRYDAHIERHDHAICTVCGVLLDIPTEVELPQQALAAAAKATKLTLLSHEIRLYGVCEHCASKQKNENETVLPQ